MELTDRLSKGIQSILLITALMCLVTIHDHLDWKVLGRRDRLVIKRFEAERDMGVSLVLDGSASMSFSDQGGASRVFEVSLRIDPGRQFVFSGVAAT